MRKIISPDTWALRQQVLQKYGGVCVCPCGCGSTNLRNMQLHHATGGGTKERESVRGANLYLKLMAQPVDPEMHPLCANCHWQESMFGHCENTPLSVENRSLPDLTETDGLKLSSRTPTVHEDETTVTEPAVIDPYAVLLTIGTPVAAHQPRVHPKPSWLKRLLSRSSWRLLGKSS